MTTSETILELDEATIEDIRAFVEEVIPDPPKRPGRKRPEAVVEAERADVTARRQKLQRRLQILYLDNARVYQLAGTLGKSELLVDLLKELQPVLGQVVSAMGAPPGGAFLFRPGQHLEEDAPKLPDDALGALVLRFQQAGLTVLILGDATFSVIMTSDGRSSSLKFDLVPGQRLTKAQTDAIQALFPRDDTAYDLSEDQVFTMKLPGGLFDELSGRDLVSLNVTVVAGPRDAE